MMATGSLTFSATAAARLDTRVVFPLFPFGLKKVITSDLSPKWVRLNVCTASASSAPVNGFIIYPLAPARIRWACSSESHCRERQIRMALGKVCFNWSKPLSPFSSSISTRIISGFIFSASAMASSGSAYQPISSKFGVLRITRVSLSFINRSGSIRTVLYNTRTLLP